MIIYVTNRRLCGDDFLERVDRLAKGKPDAIMLREKDLDVSDYESLAYRVHSICVENQVRLIVNQRVETAEKLGVSSIHLSMPDLREHRDELHRFVEIGASVHSLNEAIEAEKLGATYLVAGHVFPTDCKKGVPARGLLFLQEICDAVSVPVFAIGGITSDRVRDVYGTGASGCCVMSEAMTCMEPEFLTSYFTS